jgi:RHS repeat-associated protein
MITFLKKPDITMAPLAAILWVFLSSSLTASAFYDPGSQRWINRDPVTEGGFQLCCQQARGSGQEHANLYEFCGNSPVVQHDPFGLFLGWGYGNWCGWSRYGQKGGPIDQVDSACMFHDNCLATLADACRDFKPCNRIFCAMVDAADCQKSPNPVACKKARRTILRACYIIAPFIAPYNPF